MLAYHGSIHDFDAFDVSKIGTGEGLNTFGRGLYFAEARACAATYADGVEVLLDGKPTMRFLILGSRHGSFGDTLLDCMVAAYGEDMEALRDWIADASREPPYAVEDADFRALLEPVTALCGRIERKRIGYIYNVEFLADKAQFLDLDIPERDQPENVRKLLKPYRPKGRWVVEHDGERLHRIPAHDASISHTIRKANKARAGLEEALAALGYRGVTYLDNVSREHGEGTRNFVIFSHDDVRILGREPFNPHEGNAAFSTVAAPGALRLLA